MEGFMISDYDLFRISGICARKCTVELRELLTKEGIMLSYPEDAKIYIKIQNIIKNLLEEIR
jgi:hypothetical protein